MLSEHSLLVIRTSLLNVVHHIATSALLLTWLRKVLFTWYSTSVDAKVQLISLNKNFLTNNLLIMST